MRLYVIFLSQWESQNTCRLYFDIFLFFNGKICNRPCIYPRSRKHNPRCKCTARLSCVVLISLNPASNGSFILLDMDSGTDSVCNFNGYIVLCRTCSHCTDSDWDPYFLFLCRTGIRVHICIQVGTRVRLRQCKVAITPRFI